jgi:CBS domain-containing protein
MTTVDQHLDDVKKQLKKGLAVQAGTVRDFLRLFSAERRGYVVVQQIKEKLGKHGLTTRPNFTVAFIDSQLNYELSDAASDAQDDGTAHVDPTYRIGRLASANRSPVSVKPDDTLKVAVTLMLTRDFSQLPVMTSTRDVKGVVSWKTVGSRLALKQDCKFVRDCMEPAHIVSDNESLFDVIARIAIYDYVLVQQADRTISGIVTAADFNEQFRLLAEPFLLIGEIENGVRHMLRGKFTDTELEAIRGPYARNAKVSAISDLAFGDYVRLIDSEKNWAKLGIEIDRGEFVGRLEVVRRLRNDVMHFDPDGLGSADVDVLREFAMFLKRLRDVGAV